MFVNKIMELWASEQFHLLSSKIKITQTQLVCSFSAVKLRTWLRFWTCCCCFSVLSAPPPCWGGSNLYEGHSESCVMIRTLQSAPQSELLSVGSEWMTAGFCCCWWTGSVLIRWPRVHTADRLWGRGAESGMHCSSLYWWAETLTVNLTQRHMWPIKSALRLRLKGWLEDPKKMFVSSTKRFILQWTVAQTVVTDAELTASQKWRKSENKRRAVKISFGSISTWRLYYSQLFNT